MKTLFKNDNIELLGELLIQYEELIANMVLLVGIGSAILLKCAPIIASVNHLKQSLFSTRNVPLIINQLNNIALFVVYYGLLSRIANLTTVSAAATPTSPPIISFNASTVQIGVNNPPGVDVYTEGLSNITLILRAYVNTIPFQWVGQFMQNTPFLTGVTTSFLPKTGLARLTGSPENVSFSSKLLRFSLFDNSSAWSSKLTEIPVGTMVTSSNNVTAPGILARATVDLSYFGINRAPIPNLNATLSNATINLFQQFSIDLTDSFVDPDGDPITYSVTQPDGTTLPSNVQFNNNVLVGTFSQAGEVIVKVLATDGYKVSLTPRVFSVACLYMPPFVANRIPARLFPVGQGFTLSIPLSTFTGINLIYKALANGFPLPKGLDFNADLKLLTGFMSSDWSGNITIIATDPYKASANTTFELSVFDAPPELATPIATQTVRAKKTIVISIPPLTFIDPDNLPSPLVYMIDSLTDGMPLPSWIVYNANTKQITAIPPVEALGQDFQIVMTASDGYKSTDANITLRVLPNQPPVIGQALSDATAIANQDLNYLIPPNSFTSPVGNPLTLSVQMQGSATQQLPGWVSFNNVVNVLYGRPADTDVGIVPMVVIADDGLGGIARQTINITVQQSTLALFLYWLGLTAQAGSGVLFAWSAYAARNQVLNHFRAKKVICEHPFDENLQHKIDYPYAAYVLAERIPHREEVGKLSQWIAGAVSLMSSYFHHQFALAPLPHGSLPYWLSYHATKKIITLKPELMNEGDESVIVTVRTLEGEVLVKFTVNPAEHLSFKVLTLPKQEEDIILVDTSPETEPDSLNTSPEVPSVGYSNSNDSTPPESFIQSEQVPMNLVELHKNETCAVVVEESLVPSNVIDYGFFAKALKDARALNFEDEELESDFNIALKQRVSL